MNRFRIGSRVWVPALSVAFVLAVWGGLDPSVAAQEPPAAPAAPMAPMADQSSAAVATQEVANAIAATQLLAEADALVAAEKPAQAREKLLAALDASPDEAQRQMIEGKIGKLNVDMVRLPWAMPEKVDYVVQAGDSVRAIAQKHGTTVELIVEANRLARPDHIQPGNRLRVFQGKLAITVSKSRNDLLLTCDGRYFKRYRVGTGKYGTTPVGTFAISDRIKDPPWWRGDGQVIPFGDKENILGTRWLALKATGATPEVKGYGIHGTWEDESIGKAESAGCIRLRNEDVEELFQLVPVGTEVRIED